jgi:hypothetical protein
MVSNLLTEVEGIGDPPSSKARWSGSLITVG